MAQDKKRILLGQLAARGDCLYATTVAKQIKHDFPGCHLTWAIGSMCKSILDNNPYVDEVWEVPVANHAAVDTAWGLFMQQVEQRKQARWYDEVFLTQISPGNFQNFDGTVRSSLFRGYPHPITVPIAPVIELTQQEIVHVRAFIDDKKIKKFHHVIVFEFASLSDQSFVTLEFALACAQELVAKMQEICVILSSHIPVETGHERIIDAHTLSFRENAQLLKHCTLFIGCSSGISWLSTSDWVGRPIPTIQLLKKKKRLSASMVHDFELFNLPADKVIEMTECAATRVAACAQMVLECNLEQAKKLFHEPVSYTVADFNFYTDFLGGQMMHKHYKKALGSLVITLKRYGFCLSLWMAIVYRLCRIMRYAITDRLYVWWSRVIKKQR